MTTLFVAQGLLARDGAALRLTETAREHLVASSPWFLGPYFPKLADRPIARDLLGVLRTDQPAHFASREEQSDWHRAMEAETFAEEFTATMDCRGLLLGQALATHLDLRNHQRLLDIAGGSGDLRVLARGAVPALARVGAGEAAGGPDCGARDRGAWLQRARPGHQRRHARWAAARRSRCAPVFKRAARLGRDRSSGDLLQASARALPAGGLIVVHEAFLNAEKTGPLHIAGYSVLLMHACQGRCYSVAEMESWLSESGFETLRARSQRRRAGARWWRARRKWSFPLPAARYQRQLKSKLRSWELGAGSWELTIQALRTESKGCGLGARRPADRRGSERRHAQVTAVFVQDVQEPLVVARDRD